MTQRQRRFVEEYLKSPNFDATAAAKAAGFSAKTAPQIASRMLKIPHVKAAIESAIAARATRANISQDEVIAELRKIAFGNMGSVAKWSRSGVVFKDSATLTPEEIGSVAAVEETTTKDGGSLRIKQHDKVKALELLGKHVGMFKEDVTLRVVEPIRVIVEDYPEKKKE